MLIKEKMVSPVVTVTSETTIRDARDIMIKHNISRLPIVNDGKLVGIVVFHDIDRSLHVPGFIPEVPVEWIMSRNPVTVSQEADIVEAARLMVEHKVAGLPVVNGKDVVGIVTETDLLKFLIEIYK